MLLPTPSFHNYSCSHLHIMPELRDRFCDIYKRQSNISYQVNDALFQSSYVAATMEFLLGLATNHEEKAQN
ncbi:unnamed protein product [Linum trigynum]|uniref:Uncharacterized protein n=1 Tax=Linum trigynum TaxID=586398 RepID=A0AAV2DJD6_9ROSI